MCYNVVEIEFTSYLEPGADIMSKRLKEIKEIKIERPERAKLSAKVSLKRTQEFSKRKEKFIAAIREGKNRSLLTRST